MNLLFTLCGRAGSKGFKNKNLKTFVGVPLVYYGIAAIALYRECEDGRSHNIKVALNTDSEDLIRIVQKQNQVPVEIIKREAFLAGDTVPKVMVICDCLEQMEAQTNTPFDLLVDLDITSPLRTLEDVCAAINRKVKRPDVDVVYSVTDARRNPYFNMVKQDGACFSKAIASDYTTRQQAPEFYDMNASIYAYDIRALRSKRPEVFFNDNCDAIVMKDTGILDIDSENDFELMQAIAEFLFQHDDKFKRVFERAKMLI